MVVSLDYKGIDFPVSSKDFSKIEQKNNICINVFCYENELTYPRYVLDQKFKNCMDLLMITEENNSHYVYVKDFNRFMYNKTKINNKKHFCNMCLQCFSSERALIEHKETCLEINGKKNCKSHIPCQLVNHISLAVLLIKLFVLMINLVNQLFFTEEKMQSIDLLKQFLKKQIMVKK